MFSLRTLARAAPRTLARPALASRQILLRAAPATPSLRKFTTAPGGLRAEASGVDAELSAKLESEIQFEEEVSKEEQVPGSIKDFMEQGGFEVVDMEGKEEVRLVRSHGEEK
jgi:complement component 1 Q subcomponent-binding protein